MAPRSRRRCSACGHAHGPEPQELAGPGGWKRGLTRDRRGGIAALFGRDPGSGLRAGAGLVLGRRRRDLHHGASAPRSRSRRSRPSRSAPRAWRGASPHARPGTGHAALARHRSRRRRAGAGVRACACWRAIWRASGLSDSDGEGRRFCKSSGSSIPVIQAPMGGGFTPPELIAAVSNAGALGSLGAPYMTPAQISDGGSQDPRAHRKSFNINIFVGGYATSSEIHPAPMLALLADIHASSSVCRRQCCPRSRPVPFAAQFEAVMQARPAVFSFAFGHSHLRTDGAAKICKASLRSARRRRSRKRAARSRPGVDGIVAQGEEAGAHRGTFAGPFEAAMIPTLELVRGIVSALPVPVIASGGLMDGRDIAAAHAVRARQRRSSGQLSCRARNRGAPPAYKRALLDAAKRHDRDHPRLFRTHRRAASPTPSSARSTEEAILPFPLQNDLTRPMRARRGQAGATPTICRSGRAAAWRARANCPPPNW